MITHYLLHPAWLLHLKELLIILYSQMRSFLLSTFRHRLTHLHKFSHTLALRHCFHIKPICLHDNSVIIPKSYKVAFGIRRFESPQITSGDINPKGMYLRFCDECLGIMIYVSSGCRTSPNSIGYSASFLVASRLLFSRSNFTFKTASITGGTFLTSLGEISFNQRQYLSLLCKNSFAPINGLNMLLARGYFLTISSLFSKVKFLHHSAYSQKLHSKHY